MGKPAARVGDMHTCPLVDPGPKPHVGGPILPLGCPTVIICGMPAARIGDMATCVGPPDTIAQGAANVIVGYQSAARLGDSTAHGGKIVIGCPTVLIGGSTNTSRPVTATREGGLFGAIVGALVGGIAGAIVGFMVGGPAGAIAGAIAGAAVGAVIGYALTSTQVTHFGDSITIRGSPEFRQQAVNDLRTIEATPSGRRLLDSIDNSGHQVSIHECGPGDDGARDGQWTDAALYDGTGADARVQYNPNQTPMYNNGSAWDNPPTAITLGHELTHASHITNGNLAGNPFSGPPVLNDPFSGLSHNRALEERRTVGLGADAAFGLPDHSNEPFSENSLRRDLGEPQRTSYLDPNSGLW